MELSIQTANGSTAGALTVADHVFGRNFSEALVHQVVVAYMAAARAGTKAQKTRAEVRGGGQKPWRQKGTGRARAGTTRSPLWRGGGVTFAAVPRDYSQKVNKKMVRGAMASILSELVRQGRLIVVDGFGVEQPKTKDLLAKLKVLGLDHVLIVAEEYEDNLCLAARNLPHVDVTRAASVDPVSLVNYEKVLVTVGAVKQLEERLA